MEVLSDGFARVQPDGRGLWRGAQGRARGMEAIDLSQALAALQWAQKVAPPAPAKADQPFISSAMLRQMALSDVERGVDPQLRYPPMAEEVTAAKAQALEHAVADEDFAQIDSLFSACDKDGTLAGVLLANLLALHTPGTRPPWAVALATRWLARLSYHEPAARKSTVPLLAQLVSVRHARPGELIDGQGEDGRAAFLLLTGECSVHINLMDLPKPRWRRDEDEDDDVWPPTQAAPPPRPTKAAAAEEAEAEAEVAEAPPAFESLLATAVRDSSSVLVEAAGQQADAPDLATGDANQSPGQSVPVAEVAETAEGATSSVTQQQHQQAAVTVQAAARGHAARRSKSAKPAVDATEQKAAVTVQAAARGRAARRSRGAPLTHEGSTTLEPPASPAAQPLDDTPVDPSLLVMEHGDLLRTIGPGDVFGEHTAVLHAPRRASLVANTMCTMILIRRRTLDAFFGGATPSLAQRLRFLAALQLPLPPRLAHAFREERLERGVVLAPLGEPIEKLALVWSGSLSIRAPIEASAGAGGGSTSRDVGGMDEISVVCTGGCVGDELLLPGLATPHALTTPSAGEAQKRMPRKSKEVVIAAPYEAVAREPTLLLVLSRADVERMPKSALQKFVRGASERHLHRTSQAEQLQRRAAARTSLKSLSARRPAGAPPTSASAAALARPRASVAPSASSSALLPTRLPPMARPPSAAHGGGVELGMPHPSASPPPPTVFGAICTNKPSHGPVDPLLLGTKLLTYGRRGATDSAVGARIAAAHTKKNRSMAHVVATRMRRSHTFDGPLPLAPAVAPTPKYRELDSEANNGLVDTIREPPKDQLFQMLAKEAQDAVLQASKPTYTPPANAPSTFVQLRRMALERNFGAAAERSRMTKQFLLPKDLKPLDSEGRPTQHPPLTHGVEP